MQFRAPAPHGELAAQRLNFLAIQIRRHPAREHAGARGHLRGHVRVAVAVAADPRAESDRRRVEREALAGRGHERAVECGKVTRHSVPERLLENDESPLHFVERRWRLAPHLVGHPGRGDLSAEVASQFRAFFCGQIGAIV